MQGTQDDGRSLEIIGSEGTVLKVTATHSTNAGGGSTVYQVASPDGVRFVLAQDDVCVGKDSLVFSTRVLDSGDVVAVGVVPLWLEESASLSQGGQDLPTERFRIKGFTDILIGSQAVQGPVSLSGIDHAAVAAKLAGCAYGGAPK